jgi:hypothetical protein
MAARLSGRPAPRKKGSGTHTPNTIGSELEKEFESAQQAYVDEILTSIKQILQTYIQDGKRSCRIKLDDITPDVYKLLERRLHKEGIKVSNRRGASIPFLQKPAISAVYRY